MKQKMKLNSKSDIMRFAAVSLAAFLMAVNMDTLVHTGGLYPGGATGLTVLIQRLAQTYLNIELPYTLINLLINAFPVYIGFRFIGRKFTFLSLWMIVLSSFLTDLLPRYVITYDTLLISIFGGLVNGIVISLCLRVDATSGGTDFIAIYLSQKRGVETWNIVLAFNAVLLLIAGLFFGWDKALYSIIFQFASTQTLHALYRTYQQETLLIITNKAGEISAAIYDISHHGATILHGIGSYERTEHDVLYSVISASDVKRITKAVHEIDPKAFVNTIASQRILGYFYQKPKD